MSVEIMETALTLLMERAGGGNNPECRRPLFDDVTIRTAYFHAIDLHEAARTLERIAINECNGYKSEQAEKRDQTKAKEARADAMAALESYGVTVTFGGDPRGFVVKLQTPKSKRYNSWGGASEGWGVTGEPG